MGRASSTLRLSPEAARRRHSGQVYTVERRAT